MTRDTKPAPEPVVHEPVTTIPTALWNHLMSAVDTEVANPNNANRGALAEAQTRALAGVSGIPYREFRREEAK
jgi:hypothetical protein